MWRGGRSIPGREAACVRIRREGRPALRQMGLCDRGYELIQLFHVILIRQNRARSVTGIQVAVAHREEIASFVCAAHSKQPPCS